MGWNKKIFVTLVICAAAGAVEAQISTTRRAQSTVLHRAADRGYLGVGVIELTDDRVKALGLKDDNGVEVKRVEANSPAARAGFKVNDVILEVNGKVIEDVGQFIRAVGGTPAGDKVTLTVWRAGAKSTMTATLEARPDNPFALEPDGVMPLMPPVPPGGAWDGDAPFSSLTGSGALVGFEGETLSPQLAEFFGVKEGVLVRTVGSRTPAERAGLKAGDVVIKVNGTPVISTREISGLVRASRSKTVSFTVVRNKKEMALNVEIARFRPTSFDTEDL